MTVYIDALFLTNLFMDTVLLFLVSVLLGEIKTKRIFITAVVSALYGTVMFFPQIDFMYCTFSKVIFTAFLIYVAFGKERYFKSLIYFTLVASALAGLLFSFSVCTSAGSVFQTVISNYVVYMNVNPLIMASGCVILYFLIEVYRRSCIKDFTCDRLLIDIDVTYFGRVFKLCGLVDTGCELYEPLSGAPVIVADKRVFGDMPDLPEIFIETTSGKSSLGLILPEKIESYGKYDINNKTVVALASSGFGGRYNALINPAACSEKKKKGKCVSVC